MTSEAATYTWPDLITGLIAGQDLDADQARWAMGQVMSGEAEPVPLAGFLIALRAKGETVTELRGLADVMLEHANQITVPGPIVDIVGTGGDRHHTVNVSTMAAIVIAGAGLRVVKHGNRAASSSSGAADVLEALGVNLTLSPERVAALATDAGITFCFAQAFHPSFRHAAPARSGLGVPTAFNVLGPLTNPARPGISAVGVADRKMAPLIAGVLAERGSAAAVFRGEDGLDELTIAGPSSLWWVRDGAVTEHRISPQDVGLSVNPLSTLRGADAAHNAGVAREIFAGQKSPVRDAVVLNAGAALAAAAGAASTQTADVIAAIRDGMDRAEASLDSGAAERVLADWVARSNA